MEGMEPHSFPGDGHPPPKIRDKRRLVRPDAILIFSNTYVTSHVSVLKVMGIPDL